MNLAGLDNPRPQPNWRGLWLLNLYRLALGTIWLLQSLGIALPMLLTAWLLKPLGRMRGLVGLGHAAGAVLVLGLSLLIAALAYGGLPISGA